MPRTSTWKGVERAIASLFGDSERVPVNGRRRGSSPDIENPQYSIEVKHRKAFPAWLMDALDQAIKSVRKDKLPVVVLHQHRTKYDESLVVLRLKDFLSLTKSNDK